MQWWRAFFWPSLALYNLPPSNMYYSFFQYGDQRLDKSRFTLYLTSRHKDIFIFNHGNQSGSNECGIFLGIDSAFPTACHQNSPIISLIQYIVLVVFVVLVVLIVLKVLVVLIVLILHSFDSYPSVDRVDTTGSAM